MKHITLTVELTDVEAWELAQFIKRVRFDQCRELTESWQSRSEREEQAYRMLYALDQVAGALKLVGYAPR
jgi:hypothetical protein